MRIASLGSGSKGNSTLIQHSDTLLMVDCGFSLKQCLQRLDRLRVDPHDINAILVTHEHSDHSGGVSRLAAKFDIPIWSTIGTARRSFEPDIGYECIISDQTFSIKNISINPVTVPHDAGEPVQFIFEDIDSKISFGMLTDTGHITRHIINAYQQLDGLLLEFNYDPELLENGPYPFQLKRRVSGDLGHLSNTQSRELLDSVNLDHLDCLIAAHISEKNNCTELVADCIGTFKIPRTVIASQNEGFDWIEVRE